jgi:uncharacterized protein (DUF305 family)
MLILLALALGACGGDDDESTAPAGGNGTDRAFATEMVPHHRSAIEMAEIAERRAESRAVKQLASAIAHIQDEEVVVLRREDAQLARAGVKRGSLGVPHHQMGMDDDPATLRDAKPFDRAFLEMMIPHHEGAIRMARAQLAKGTDPELRDLAQRIVTSQEREIRFMRRALAGDAGGKGGAAVPDGGQAEGHSGQG